MSTSTRVTPDQVQRYLDLDAEVNDDLSEEEQNEDLSNFLVDSEEQDDNNDSELPARVVAFLAEELRTREEDAEELAELAASIRRRHQDRQLSSQPHEAWEELAENTDNWWKVTTVLGKEQAVVNALKAVSGTRHAIFFQSLPRRVWYCSTGGVKDHVSAIRSVHVRHPNPIKVPPEDMVGVEQWLRRRDPAPEYVCSSFARVQRGRYKGDVCVIEKVLPSQHMRVGVIPRLGYIITRLESLKRKRRSERALIPYGKLGEYRSADTKYDERHDIFKCDGYIFKDGVHVLWMDAVLYLKPEPNPTIEDLEPFLEAAYLRRTAFEGIARIVKLRWQHNQRVCTETHFGRVQAVDEDTKFVDFNTLENEIVSVSIDSASADWRLGDSVRVAAGLNKGKAGLLQHVHPDYVLITVYHEHRAEFRGSATPTIESFPDLIELFEPEKVVKSVSTVHQALSRADLYSKDPTTRRRIDSLILRRSWQALKQVTDGKGGFGRIATMLLQDDGAMVQRDEDGKYSYYDLQDLVPFFRYGDEVLLLPQREPALFISADGYGKLGAKFDNQPTYARVRIVSNATEVRWQLLAMENIYSPHNEMLEAPETLFRGNKDNRIGQIATIVSGQWSGFEGIVKSISKGKVSMDVSGRQMVETVANITDVVLHINPQYTLSGRKLAVPVDTERHLRPQPVKAPTPPPSPPPAASGSNTDLIMAAASQSPLWGETVHDLMLPCVQSIVDGNEWTPWVIFRITFRNGSLEGRKARLRSFLTTKEGRCGWVEWRSDRGQMYKADVPIDELLPSPPSKKDQTVVVLEGDHKGGIGTIVKCPRIKIGGPSVTLKVKVGEANVQLSSDRVCLLSHPLEVP